MKHFHNTEWISPMRFLVASIMFLLMLPCLCSCENNMVQPENKEERVLPVAVNPESEGTVGNMHNDALGNILVLTARECPNGEKVSYEVFRENAVWVMNKVAEAYGYQERITPEMCDKIFEKFNKLKAKKIYDFSDPVQEGVELQSVIEKLVNEGIITPEKGAQHLKTFQEFESKVSELADKTLFNRDMLKADVLDISKEEDGLLESADFWFQMDRYVIENPELQGWWDEWKKTIRELSLIGCDFLGFVIGTGGTPVGQAFMGILASAAFIVLWAPY